jgi:chromosomal replication initiation ATPase DnaA
MAELTHVAVVKPDAPRGTLLEDEDRAPLPSLTEMAREAVRLNGEGRLKRDVLELDAPPVKPAPRVVPPWMPDRFREESFDTFAPASGSQHAALRAVRTWVKRTLEGRGDMLALIGATGAGKSHLLYAAGRCLLEAGTAVYSRPWYLLADELRYGGRSAFNEEKRLDPAEVREALWRARVVLIDEVRPTAGTAFDDTELAKLACHAYDRRIAVLITTNVSPLGDVIGPAAASRFTQITVAGPDRRQA